MRLVVVLDCNIGPPRLLHMLVGTDAKVGDQLKVKIHQHVVRRQIAILKYINPF